MDEALPPTRFDSLETPCLLLDADRMQANIVRLRSRLARLGVHLRPHLKTAKSIEVARVVTAGGTGPITVSTLKEAEYFVSHGVKDILYAVGITPNKLDHVFDLRRRGADLTILLDNLDSAKAVAAAARAAGDRLPVLIEIDCDGHRSGVQPGDTGHLVAIGRVLQDGGAALAGVMTHAGSSYDCRDEPSLVAVAEAERAAAVRAAEALRAAGLPCPTVSVGSTPTAFAARDLAGVTEVRAGVFVFFDLVMAGIGVCAPDDVALSVLATVLGHQRDKGWIIVDAGWMAMSRDRGTARQPLDQGYGLVCDADGRPYADLIMIDANQEHGILAVRPGSAASCPDLPVGSSVRILPNHACATGAQHDRYHVVRGGDRRVHAVWQRFNGW